MQGQDLDSYIAWFEELVQHTDCNMISPQTIDMFTWGLPITLYETIYQHNQLETFKQ